MTKLKACDMVRHHYKPPPNAMHPTYKTIEVGDQFYIPYCDNAQKSYLATVIMFDKDWITIKDTDDRRQVLPRSMFTSLAKAGRNLAYNQSWKFTVHYTNWEKE